MECEGLQTVRGGVTIMAVLFVCTSGIRRSSQSIDPHYLENRVTLSTLGPVSCGKVAPGIDAELPSRGRSGEWTAAIVLRAEIDQI